jgi:hypothetical protein
MNVDKITRFSFDGPNEAGLEEWEAMDVADLDSEIPVQRGYLYYNDEKLGFKAGVWDCTPFSSKMAPYPCDEFMHVLEGSITIEQEDGVSTTVSPGESFAIPKGLVCRWVQTKYVRKFFMISNNVGGKVHENPAQYGVICPRTDDPVSPIVIKGTSLIIGGIPEQQINNYYTDATGQFTVGLWHSTPFERPVYEFDRFDLMMITKGVATISDGAGDDQVFKAGEAAFVPKGAQYKWMNDEPVSKIYCAFTPNDTA